MKESIKLRLTLFTAVPNLGLVPLAIRPALGDLMDETALETFLTKWLVLALALLSGVEANLRGVFVELRAKLIKLEIKV